MRILFLKDTEIPKAFFNKVVKEFKKIYEDNAFLDIEYHTDEWTMTHLPYEEYYGGFWGLNRRFLNHTAQMVDTFDSRPNNPIRKKFDHIVFCVHDKNFTPAHKPNGVWGWNMGWGVRGYEVQQVRFDPNSLVNSLATLYHEVHHSHKWFPLRTTGLNVEWVTRLDLRLPDWGTEVTHGEHPKWEYIGRRTGTENLESVQLVKGILQHAYQRRRDNFTSDPGITEQVVAKYRAFKVSLIAPEFEM